MVCHLLLGIFLWFHPCKAQKNEPNVLKNMQGCVQDFYHLNFFDIVITIYSIYSLILRSTMFLTLIMINILLMEEFITILYGQLVSTIFTWFVANRNRGKGSTSLTNYNNQPCKQYNLEVTIASTFISSRFMLILYALR